MLDLVEDGVRIVVKALDVTAHQEPYRIDGAGDVQVGGVATVHLSEVAQSHRGICALSMVKHGLHPEIDAAGRIHRLAWRVRMGVWRRRDNSFEPARGR